jgi:hypothetical protein
MVGWVLAVLGISVLIAGVVVIVIGALLFGPIMVWLAWNVLDLASAVGAPELGFWGFILVALFLALGLAGRAIIVALVFIIDPSWFQGEATLHWPEPTLKNYLAIFLLLLVASVSSGHHWDRGPKRSKQVPPPGPSY